MTEPRVVTIRVHRLLIDPRDTAALQALHRERSQMLHGLVDAVGLQVKDWGLTDGEQPKEAVDVILEFFSRPAAAIAGEVVKWWLDRRRVLDVEIVTPDGTEISIRRLPQGQLEDLGRILWSLPSRRAVARPGGRQKQ